ncbi:MULTISPECIES: hypothetical protein [Streptomyces]|uniref:Uncharacterized protein n=1 Tax=Streptomyces fimbriatus TaxID=68197 RepID=A0ABW0DGK3_STRFI
MGCVPLGDDGDAVAVVAEREWSGRTETAFVARGWTVYRVPGTVAFGDALEQFRTGFRTPRHRPWPEAPDRTEES